MILEISYFKFTLAIMEDYRRFKEFSYLLCKALQNGGVIRYADTEDSENIIETFMSSYYPDALKRVENDTRESVEDDTSSMKCCQCLEGFGYVEESTLDEHGKCKYGEQCKDCYNFICFRCLKKSTRCSACRSKFIENLDKEMDEYNSHDQDCTCFKHFIPNEPLADVDSEI
jgi:hypothetical protein